MLYPFYVLGLPEDATDEQVHARYLALLREYPPDRAPVGFRFISEAYGAIRTAEQRANVRLSIGAPTGASFAQRLDEWEAERPLPRLTPEQLAELLRGEAP